MRTKLCKMLTRLVALLIILTLMPSQFGLAVSDPHPEVAVPFEGELTSGGELQLGISLATVVALVGGDVFQNGADRLTALQNNDGGWDWPLTDGNPASVSPKNTVGPIAEGLAKAYLYTGDPDHRAALQDAGALLLAKTNNFSPSDGYLAATLDDLLGVTTYTDHLMNNFYGPLAAGTYDRNGVNTDYDTAEYVNLIRVSRSGSQANLAAWDIGMGLVGAAAAGADTSAWIAGVKAEINELNGDGWYDVIGLAGALYGLAYVGEDFDPIAGEHAAADSLDALGATLVSYQISSGGFAWNSNYVVPNDGNETIQETAYAVLAFAELNQKIYLSAIKAAADYMASVQLSTGGWENYPMSGENNEITGEALWGIYTTVVSNQPPIAEANGPYVVAIGQSVVLDPVGSYDPDGDQVSFDWLVTGPLLGTTANETFVAENVVGITAVTLTVNDGWGGTATDTAMVVVYDPTGGFVTGGGWITSPEGAMSLPGPVAVWNQDFSTDASGWFGDGITVDSGVAELSLPGEQFSRFDGYRDIWPGTYTAEIDVYLDPNWPADQGFDYSVASNGSDGLHQRDFIFHVGTVENYGPIVGKELLVAVDNNAYGDTNPFVLTTRPGGYYVVPTAGWYTLQHVFYDAGGYLAVDFNILDSNSNVVWSDTRSDMSDTIPGEVGGNRYAFFAHIDVAAGIQVDNHQLILDEIPSLEGRATFGFVSKYKKGASVPEGNTEFQFKAGNLNFNSTSYEWLVVNQTGTNAQFKGYGTINGTGNYGFMLWATDGSPDQFRIKIWDAATEAVVYDNGTDQVIGGGSIVVHKK